MNGYYLIAGIISILFAVNHAVWGERKIMSTLEHSEITLISKSSFNIAWHQMTAILLVAGLMLCILSFVNKIEGQDLIALTIAFFYIANFLTCLTFILIKYPSLFKRTWLQSLGYLVVLVLIFVGFYH